jgi:hypothetical protein
MNIWDLDRAITLRDKIQRRKDAIRAVQHGNAILVRSRHQGVEFDLHNCFSMAEFRVRLNDLLKEEIEHCKMELRALGVDPDADPTTEGNAS